MSKNLTNSPQYLQNVTEIMAKISAQAKYSPEIINTVKIIALNRSPENSRKYLEPTLRLPDFEGNEGLNYYKLVVGADKIADKNAEIKIVEVTVAEILANTKTKVFFTLGLDAGREDNIAKYTSISGRLGVLINCRAGTNLAEKLDGFYFINHKISTENKFKLDEKTLNNYAQNSNFNNKIVGQFYDELFSKLLENSTQNNQTTNNQNKTVFINHSFGSIFIEEAQIEAVKNLQNQSADDKNINQKIQAQFDNFSIIQLGAPSLDLPARAPRIKTISLIYQADMMFPAPKMFFPTTDECGKMLDDFQIFSAENNPNQQTIIINQNLVDKTQMNFGAHYLPRYIDGCFGVDAPQKLKNALVNILNNSCKTILFEGAKCTPEDQAALEKTLNLYCQQLVDETTKWAEIKYEKQTPIIINNAEPQKFTEQTQPHKLVQKLGFIL